MNPLLKLAGVSLVAASLSGCVVSIGNEDFWDDDGWEQRQRDNNRFISRLTVGDSRQSIEAHLGTADFSDGFMKDGESYVVLYYRTHHEKGDGKTTRDETTPLLFVDDTLVGWGETALGMYQHGK